MPCIPETYRQFITHMHFFVIITWHKIIQNTLSIIHTIHWNYFRPVSYTHLAHKDRHANIGQGEIGFDALYDIVHHPDFADVPKILETPYLPDPDNPKKTLPPYKEEIAMLRGGTI